MKTKLADTQCSKTRFPPQPIVHTHTIDALFLKKKTPSGQLIFKNAIFLHWYVEKENWSSVCCVMQYSSLFGLRWQLREQMADVAKVVLLWNLNSGHMTLLHFNIQVLFHHVEEQRSQNAAKRALIQIHPVSHHSSPTIWFWTKLVPTSSWWRSNCDQKVACLQHCLD